MWLGVSRGHVTCISKGLSECKGMGAREGTETQQWAQLSGLERAHEKLQEQLSVILSLHTTTFPFLNPPWQAESANSTDDTALGKEQFCPCFLDNFSPQQEPVLSQGWAAAAAVAFTAHLEGISAPHTFSWKETTTQPKHTHFYFFSCQAEQIHNVILPKVSCHFSRSDKVGIHRKDPDYIYIYITAGNNLQCNPYY